MTLPVSYNEEKCSLRRVLLKSRFGHTRPFIGICLMAVFVIPSGPDAFLTSSSNLLTARTTFVGAIKFSSFNGGAGRHFPTDSLVLVPYILTMPVVGQSPTEIGLMWPAENSALFKTE